jgi:hypothetical protein
VSNRASSASFQPAFTIAFVLLVSVAAGGTGCGRSGLDDYFNPEGGLIEGGPEAGPDTGPDACNPNTCPQGCCDGAGHCQSGTDVAACGALGAACQDCEAKGFSLCEATHHSCGNPVVNCGPGDCATGCCEGTSQGPVCFAGTDPNACGTGGQGCQQCATAGLVCDNQQCTKPTCGPGNCGGCCFGDQCVGGIDATACGQGGQQCRNCLAQGDTCSPSPGSSGGICVATPGCGPGCQGCCDLSGVCEPGTLPYACGAHGGSCQNCQSLGEPCLNQQCGFQGCGPWNCQGCCDSSGVCQQGIFDNQCGQAGQSCFNCEGQGEKCEAQQCVPPTQGCNPQTCGFGCCDQFGNCQPGFANNECGGFGGSCTDCAMFGASCFNQQCSLINEGGPCGPQNCPGCCDQFDNCQPGVFPNACGFFGNFCQNCFQFGPGEECLNQQCTFINEGGGCGPQNCPGCCDQFGNCQPGAFPNACGTFGSFCQNCLQFGEECLNQQCVFIPDSGPDVSLCSLNCQGCCDSAGNCLGGFLNNQCGSFGSTCQDCTTLSPPSTCDTSLSPRTCTSQQMQCPSPYTGCPPSLTEPVLTEQKGACTTMDLQQAAAACAAGANSTACQSFFQFEFQQNQVCYNCLQPFDFDFSQNSGVVACAAASLDPTCNHNSACFLDCYNQSCAACPDQTTFGTCEMQVVATSGQCSSFYQSEQCVNTALAGPASFCNPSTYSNNFGAWLQGVGAQYCQ